MGGRPAFDPQLLTSLWVYACSLDIGSAREIARRCEWDPGFQWLTGGEVVNYHTLAEVRVEWAAQLEETDKLAGYFAGADTIPLPSRIVIIWLAFTCVNRSSFPVVGHLTSMKSTVRAFPRPKCNLRSP